MRTRGVMVAVWALSGCMVEEDIGTAGQEVVQGSLTVEFPAVGQLLIGATPEDASAKCSGTLVGCNTFLTAAHCVCADDAVDCDTSLDPARGSGQVFFPQAGFHDIASVAVHPDGFDLAVVTLSRPVIGIEPLPIAVQSPAVGSAVVVVGFGRAGGTDYERGIKRRGDAEVVLCEDGGCEITGDSGTCNGDSGGPTLVVSEGGAALAGVHVSVNSEDCLGENGEIVNYEVDVAAHREFISGMVSGAQVSATCDGTTPVGVELAAMAVDSGRLEQGESTEITINVPPGTAELRVALNSSDLVIPADVVEGAGRLGPDLDLLVRAVDTVEAQPECVAAGSSPNGYCEIASPSPGVWTFTVSAKSEGTDQGGDFQLTTTVLSGAPMASGERYDVGGDQPLVADAAAGVLPNDQPTALGELSAILVTPASHGEVELGADGSFVYEPEPGYRGPDSFSYRATDGAYQSSPTTVLLMVYPTAEENVATGGCGAAGGGSPAGAAVILLLCLLFSGACGARRAVVHGRRPRIREG